MMPEIQAECYAYKYAVYENVEKDYLR